MSLAPNCICGASFNYCVDSPKCMRTMELKAPVLEPSIMKISLSNDEEILRFEKNGLIYYRERPITEDKQIVDGFIEFLSAQGLYTKPVDKSKKVVKKTKNKKIYKIRDKKTGKYLTSTFGKNMWARFPSEYINGSRSFEYKKGDFVVDEFELNPINTYDLKGKLI